jgi:hypothetical protein
MTDSIAVEVANVTVDTLKQKMFDIKDIQPAKANQGLVEIPFTIGLIVGISCHLLV